MKNIAILTFVLLISAVSFAQDNSSNKDQIKSVFGKNKDTHLGWFVGLDNSYTQFGSRDVRMSGLSAGVIINHSFSIGFSGSGWTHRNSMFYDQVTDTAGAYLEGGFGQLLLEYTPFATSPLHLSFPLLIGGGGASYVTDKEYFDREDNEWDDHHKVLDSDGFFTIEPGIRAEVNVFRFMRVNAGVSYRYVSGLELMRTSPELMNNLSATVGLKFGRF